MLLFCSIAPRTPNTNVVIAPVAAKVGRYERGTRRTKKASVDACILSKAIAGLRHARSRRTDLHDRAAISCAEGSAIAGKLAVRTDDPMDMDQTMLWNSTRSQLA